MDAATATGLLEMLQINAISSQQAARAQLEHASQGLLGCAARASETDDASSIDLEIEGVRRLADMCVYALESVQSALSAREMMEAVASSPLPPAAGETAPARLEVLAPSDRTVHVRRIGGEVAEAAAVMAANLGGLSSAMTDFVSALGERPGEGLQVDEVDGSQVSRLLDLVRASNAILDQRLRELGEVATCHGSA